MVVVVVVVVVWTYEVYLVSLPTTCVGCLRGEYSTVYYPMGLYLEKLARETETDICSINV